jgi:serine/threonine protein kinase
MSEYIDPPGGTLLQRKFNSPKRKRNILTTSSKKSNVAFRLRNNRLDSPIGPTLHDSPEGTTIFGLTNSINNYRNSFNNNHYENQDSFSPSHPIHLNGKNSHPIYQHRDNINVGHGTDDESNDDSKNNISFPSYSKLQSMNSFLSASKFKESPLTNNNYSYLKNCHSDSKVKFNSSNINDNTANTSKQSALTNSDESLSENDSNLTSTPTSQLLSFSNSSFPSQNNLPRIQIDSPRKINDKTNGIRDDLNCSVDESAFSSISPISSPQSFALGDNGDEDDYVMSSRQNNDFRSDRGDEQRDEYDRHYHPSYISLFANEDNQIGNIDHNSSFEDDDFEINNGINVKKNRKKSEIFIAPSISKYSPKRCNNSSSNRLNSPQISSMPNSLFKSSSDIIGVDGNHLNHGDSPISNISSKLRGGFTGCSCCGKSHSNECEWRSSYEDGDNDSDIELDSHDVKDSDNENKINIFDSSLNHHQSTVKETKIGTRLRFTPLLFASNSRSPIHEIINNELYADDNHNITGDNSGMVGKMSGLHVGRKQKKSSDQIHKTSLKGMNNLGFIDSDNDDNNNVIRSPVKMFGGPTSFMDALVVASNGQNDDDDDDYVDEDNFLIKPNFRNSSNLLSKRHKNHPLQSPFFDINTGAREMGDLGTPLAEPSSPADLDIGEHDANLDDDDDDEQNDPFSIHFSDSRGSRSTSFDDGDINNDTSNSNVAFDDSQTSIISTSDDDGYIGHAHGRKFIGFGVDKSNLSGLVNDTSIHKNSRGLSTSLSSSANSSSIIMPMPDQSAFDRSINSNEKISPSSSPKCPATPMRTPSWAYDSDLDSNRGSTSSNNGHFSLVSTKLLISQDDSLELSDDVSYSRDFIQLGVLGTGTFADVYKVKDMDNKLYAIKKSRRQFRSKKDREWLLSEVRTMKHIGSHPCKYIVQLIKAWQENGFFYVQIDLAERGTLKDMIIELDSTNREVPTCTIWRVIHDVFSGLQHIHDSGMVHLDIKPANLLIASNGIVKVGDFGMAVEQGQGEDGHEGDTKYMAPELLNSSDRMPTADIFSLGITLYELSMIQGKGNGLYVLPSEGLLWHELREGKAAPIKDRDVKLVNIISICMAAIPNQRPLISQVLQDPLVQAASSSNSKDVLLNSALHIVERTPLLRSVSVNQMMQNQSIPTNIIAGMTGFNERVHTPTGGEFYSFWPISNASVTEQNSTSIIPQQQNINSISTCKSNLINKQNNLDELDDDDIF